MRPEGTVILKRSEVAALLSLDKCMAAVEQAFRLYAEGRTTPPGILGIPVPDGGFHIKAGLLDAGRPYFAAKTNANFTGNMKRFGLPLIQGVIVLCDGENGYPLALMDSMEITIIRTGAATGVATNYLARPESRVATICGCGNQGRVSLRAMARVRKLTGAFAWDIDDQQARRFATELSEELGLPVDAVGDLDKAVGQSDICITCTPSTEPFLERRYVKPGTFIAAVGADSENKQEVDPMLVASSKVIVDLLEQCRSIGELHHAIARGLITAAHVHAELGEIIAGKKAGRASDDEIIVFDSTGTALQDVAAAALVYEAALISGIGTLLDLAG
jgi:alanine dehydrogenase